MENTKEWIVCPQCHRVQQAIIEHDTPFDIRIHECVECKYIIQESEWHLCPPEILGGINSVTEQAGKEFASELLKAMTAMGEKAAFMQSELNKYFTEMVYRIYRQLYIDKTILVAASLAYGFKLDSCWRISRWYWRRRMNKANKAIEPLDVKLTAMQKEYPDICKPTLTEM